MSKLDITKRVVKFVVGTSVSFAVANVIGNNVNPSKPHQKVECWIGGVVVGMMVAEKAEGWIDKKLDNAVESYNKAKNQN